MDLVKKYRLELGFYVFLIFFLFTRLYNILLLPIFTDESIYIYWAKTIVTTHAHFLISLSDGKPPLLVWMISVLLSILPSNLYLLAGRLPSVLSGFLAVIAIYKLTYILFKDKKAAYIAMLLYTITPFTLFYDRMALFDSLLCSMLLWSVYFSIKTAASLLYKDAILWGIFLGVAFLAKPPAQLFLFLTPVCFFVFADHKVIFKDKKKLLILLIIPILISLTFDNFQRISGAYALMQIKNRQFQYPITEVIKDPLLHVPSNFKGLFNWLISYMTIPIFVSGFISSLFLIFKKRKEGLVLFGFWLLPIIAFGIIGREIFPRYILFVVPYLIIPFSFVLSTFIRKSVKFSALTIIVFVVIVFQALNFDYLIITNPPKAEFPETDYHQYISDHPSGYGLDKIFSFIHEKSKTEKITVVTQGTFGLYPYAFNLEFWDNPNVVIIGDWPLLNLNDKIINAKKVGRVYLIFKEQTGISTDIPLETILKAEKPGGRYPIFLTELTRVQ